ncbi:MAG: hypothetical protein KF784_00795 [Fimbriimonadaceae bacterium]|nr:hypothetical protein [Fimbriimonadaceae bacterium]
MKARLGNWKTALLCAVLGAAIIGFSIAGYIVRKEGFEGLLNRKKSVIKSTFPEAMPIVDKAEKAIKESGN